MIFGGGRHARNIAHSIRIRVVCVFLQDGFRDLSGDPPGPHFGVILGAQSPTILFFGGLFEGRFLGHFWKGAREAGTLEGGGGNIL